MKSGASDPFGDEADEDETQEETAAEESDAGDVAETAVSETRRDEGSETAASNTPAQTGGSSPEAESDSATNESKTTSDGSDGDSSVGLSRDQLPYVLRRERVKDERPEVHQLFVQQETHEEAIEAERRLEDVLDEDLSRTDAREAIYRAGMQHLDDAEEILREWGYDL